MNKLSSIQLKVNFMKEGRQVVAYSPALDISTVGSSEKNAKERFEEMVDIFFKDISDRNVVNEVLTGLGWKKVNTSKVRSQWVPPSIKSVDVRVPFPV